MIKLSVIVPVYNVELYIRPCIESIFKQGLNEVDYEVIIVNDGTPDHSMEVIQDIIHQHQNIIIINQENQGLSNARNNGIDISKGEYLLFLDSDDLLIDNSLNLLLTKAFETEVDLLVADYLTMTNEEIDNSRDYTQLSANTEFTEKIGKQLFLEDLTPLECCVWRTLYKKEFLTNNHISFIPGIIYEDIPFTHHCYIKAQKSIRTNLAIILYRKRPGSLTLFHMDKTKDYCISIAKTWELSYNEELSPLIRQKLYNHVFTFFSLFIYLISCEKCSSSEKLKAIQHLKVLAPQLSFKNGIKQKAYTFLYKEVPIILFSLRNIYGKIVEDRILPFYYHKLRRQN